MLDFHVDVSSGVPPYAQLVQQVKQALRLGWLQPGDRLPPVHELAASVAINPNTVHKAYRELEREGLVRARPGLGTFVTRLPSGTDPATQARFLAELTGWLGSARSAGLGADDIEAIYRTAFRACFAEGVA